MKKAGGSLELPAFLFIFYPSGVRRQAEVIL